MKSIVLNSIPTTQKEIEMMAKWIAMIETVPVRNNPQAIRNMLGLVKSVGENQHLIAITNWIKGGAPHARHQSIDH